MTILKTFDLTKEYHTPQGVITALDDLSLTIPRGATALLGPNGSGKTTLLKIALGLIKPTSGTYALFGTTGEERQIERNRIGFMPETPSIISKVNSVKYVRHFAILSGLSFTRAMQRAHEVLDYVGLEEARYREISDYSTGMKQRLLFAQSLVHDPDVVILDEPTTGLSPEGREEMLGLIKEINQEYGKSIIFSTHILPDVEDIANYAVLIDKGKRVLEATMEEISNMYQESVVVELDKNFDSVIDVMKNKGFTVERTPKAVIISSGNGFPSLNELYKLIQPTGAKVLSFKRHKPNLEDLFLNRIKEDIGAD